MFYSFIKFISRISLFLFYRQITVCGEAFKNSKGPTLILANHPNSFLDAIIIGIYYNRPFHFLVRSDMFNNPFLKWLLKSLNGIPVFRISEEKSRLRENKNSFKACIDILKKGETVLIFAEGITIHDWDIKPIKSGPARLLWDAMLDEELHKNLTILPITINYNQYTHAGKHVHLFSGNPIENLRPSTMEKYGEWNTRLKIKVREELKKIAFVFSSPIKDEMTIWKSFMTNVDQFQKTKTKRPETINRLIMELNLTNSESLMNWLQEYFPFNNNKIYKNLIYTILLMIPAIAGLLLIMPFYTIVHVIVKMIFRKGIFFDSVLFAGLTVLFPFYCWLLCSVLGNYFEQPNWSFALIIITSGLIYKYWLVHFASLFNYSNTPIARRKYLQKLVNPM